MVTTPFFRSVTRIFYTSVLYIGTEDTGIAREASIKVAIMGPKDIRRKRDTPVIRGTRKDTEVIRTKISIKVITDLMQVNPRDTR